MTINIKFEERLLEDAWSSMDRHQTAEDRNLRTLEFIDGH
jgi:hypothetical protein